MSAGLWFLFWVGGLAALGSITGAVRNMLLGAVLGFVIWCIFGFFVLLGGMTDGNHCREYGYPDQQDTSEGKTCSDEDIDYFIEHR